MPSRRGVASVTMKKKRDMCVSRGSGDFPRAFLAASEPASLTDLQLAHLTVLYPGGEPYALARNITVVPMAWLARNDAALLLGPLRARRTGRS